MGDTPAIVDLKKLLAAEWPDEVPTEKIPEVLGELERAKAQLWSRMMMGGKNGTGVGEDERITVAQAAKILCRGEDWVYDHADELPGVKREGGRIFFSKKALLAYSTGRGRGRGSSSRG